jgi:peptidoglycan/LPS O-acetylase OafA/YrhL
MTNTHHGRLGRTLVGIACLLNGGVMLVFGLWALLLPTSFAVMIDFPPYNEHLLHDVGAFQLGLGAALFAALALRRTLVAALVGVGAASVLHAGAHAVDGHLGGRPTDPWVLGLLAALVVLALVVAWRGEGAAPRR